MGILLAGLIVFLGIHTVQMVAPDWRQARIDAMGVNAWRGLYSLVSLAGLGLIIWGYSLARYETDFLYVSPDWMVLVTMGLMLIALVLMIAREMPPGYIKTRISHPMITGIMLWAVAHLLVNGDTASLLLFGSLLVWAIFNRISVGRRPPVTFEFVSVRYDLMALVAGILVWLLLIVWLHPILFGVEVIA